MMLVPLKRVCPMPFMKLQCPHLLAETSPRTRSIARAQSCTCRNKEEEEEDTRSENLTMMWLVSFWEAQMVK